MRTIDLTGVALDWAVAKAAGLLDHKVKIGTRAESPAVVIDGGHCLNMSSGQVFSPSTRPDQAHVFIDSMFKISVRHTLRTRTHRAGWYASSDGRYETHGDTPMQAAMRSYVLRKLGAGVKLPEELL